MRKSTVIIFLLVGLCAHAAGWEDAIERSLLRGIGRPMPLGELVNLHRSAVTLPDPPDIAPGKLIFPRLNDRRLLQLRIQSNPPLADAIRYSVTLNSAQADYSKAYGRASMALLLSLYSVAFTDTTSANQAWRQLLLLPPPPTSGGPSENDSSLPWGDLLEGSSALADAALAFDMLRIGRPVDEQNEIASTLIHASERIRNGAELVGPNNHASSTGANLAVALLALSNSDFSHRTGERLELWRVAERLMQIGLAQVGSDGVYREGPGYAQVVLADVTRLSILLHEHGGGNLLHNQLLHRFAVVTAQFSRNNGAPLPFDDSRPVGRNLWQEVAVLLPNEPLISQLSASTAFASVPEDLFLIARYTAINHSTTGITTTANMYRDGGMAIVRKSAPIPWLVAMTGEPRNHWTGRHEQIDPGNLVCEVGGALRITTGGYGPAGVNDTDRRYWLSGEAFSAFLVDGDPLHQTADSDENENSPTWTGVTWDEKNLLARQTWNQSNHAISRTMLTIGDRVVIIDCDHSNISHSTVESQFQLLGNVTTKNAGNWIVGKPGTSDALQIGSIPSEFGTMREGIVTENTERSDKTTRLRLPISPIQCTILTPGDSNATPIQRFANDSGEVLRWTDNTGNSWHIQLCSTDSIHSLLIQSISNSGIEYSYFESANSANPGSYQLHLRDKFGDAFYPALLPNGRRDSVSLVRFRNEAIVSHDTSYFINTDGWFVSGSPRFRLQETLPPPRQSRLARLASVHDNRTTGEHLQSWSRDDRAALEAEIADSLEANLSKGADSLGVGRTAAIAMAVIDATTDGFAPGKFRIPFDTDENLFDDSSKSSRVRVRGKWGGGLELDHARYDWQNSEEHWAVERSAPFHNYERYQAEWGNRSYDFSANHADGDRSGFDAGYHRESNEISTRVERLANNRFTLQSLGNLNEWRYAFRGNDSLHDLTSQWLFHSGNSIGRIGGEVSDDRTQRATTGNSWIDFDFPHALHLYSWSNISGFTNRLTRLEQYSSPYQNWFIQYESQNQNLTELRLRGYSPHIPFTNPQATLFSLQWSDSHNPWVQYAKVSTPDTRTGVWSLFTERPDKRQWGTEWQWSALPWITAFRIAAQDRLDCGACQIAYLASKSSYTLDVNRDPQFTDATATVGIHESNVSIGEWRIECGWHQPTVDWFHTQNSGIAAGALERHEQSSTDWGQRIVWTIGPGEEKSAEGGITIRW